jgi:hypothetical protein
MRDTHTITKTDLWTYPDYHTWRGTDITGFSVEATDGGIGSVDEATYDVGASYVVVDTGPWIFGKKVMLPAGIIERVSVDDRRVSLRLTKREIEDAPEFDASAYSDEAYRRSLADYYEQRREGFRDMER